MTQESKYLRIPLLGVLPVLLYFASLSLPAAAEETAGFPMLFHLLPSDGRQAPPQDLEKAFDDFLLEGQIYLYREGETKPSVVLEANFQGDVPPGKWLWVAEAPGYVSTFSGSFMISEEMASDPTATVKILVQPVVPACRIQLDDGSNWKGVQRVDFVSFDQNVVYLLFPEKRRSRWIPAGHNLTYSVDNRGLQGITDLGTCRQHEWVTMAPPEAPPAGFQDFMVHLAPGEELNTGALNWADLVVVWEGSTGEQAPAPVGWLWAGGRWTLFFLGVPTAGDWRLVARHPKLRSLILPVDSADGSARELPPQTLKPRRDFTYQVDFRTKRPHEDARLVVYYCGRNRRPPKELGQCAAIVHEEPLREGLHDYVLEDLDDGLYWPEAAVDGERVLFLGSNESLYLDPEDDEIPLRPVFPLHEMEIYGNILVAGEPVEGAVNLLPPSMHMPRDVDRFERFRSFPTDADLLYHLYFFGRLQWHREFPPKEGEADPPRGLFVGTERVQACSGDDFCRTYNYHSSFAGEGRLDFDIDTGRKLTVVVTDAADGRPVADAWVVFSDMTNCIDFKDGEVDVVEPRGVEPAVTFSDGEGRVYLRPPLKVEKPMTVRKEGYRKYRGHPPTGEDVVWDVALEREDEKPAPSATRVVFEDDGQPVGQGYFLLVREDGTRDLKCSQPTSQDGLVWFDDGCLDIGIAIFVHPNALFTIFNQRLLAVSPVVRVRRGPARPLVLRVSGGSGQPLAGVAVGFRFSSLTLHPNDLLFATGKTHRQIYFRTDQAGQLVLHNVSPDMPEAPEILVGLPGGQTGSVSLAAAVDGVLDFVVE